MSINNEVFSLLLPIYSDEDRDSSSLIAEHGVCFS